MATDVTEQAEATNPARSLARAGAAATAGAIAIAAVAFGVWQVRSVVILLLLALTFAAAIRPGVEWLEARRVPQPAAIGVFFLLLLAAVGVFCWLAVPPALHQIGHALVTDDVTGGDQTGVRLRVLVWVREQLSHVPTGHELLHPVATYGRKATDAVVTTFFTLAATWYWVSERDRMIELLTALNHESKRDKARQMYLSIDQRLGAYTRLRFAMVFAVGATLSLGFYLVGLDYWLLVGGFVGLVEIVPVIGPLIGALLVIAVGLPQSVHIAALALLVLVGVREFQSYVVNPHVMGHSVGLSPLVTLVSVAVVGVLFGGFAVVLAVPFTSAVATLIDVLVLGHEPPSPQRAKARDVGSSLHRNQRETP
jgi:predicted PurR-regulated permease PerM